ncbi:MAG: hypothetical protein ABR968_14230 [Bacteroidales bacterium]|jgi:hypothetical protein
MKKASLLVFHFILFILCAFSQEKDKSIKLIICPGINISKLKTDSAGMENIALPQIGLLASKEIMKKIDINGGLEYYFAGARQNAPRYRFQNSYLDLLLSPQYTMQDFIKLQVGCQYSYLIKSLLIIPNYQSSGETKRIALTGKYHNQFNCFAGIGFNLQKYVCLNFKYNIPLKSCEFSNFQISLNITLKKEYFTRRDTSVHKDLNGIEYESKDKSYTEDNGIIYPADISEPPQFKGGLNDMNQYFEDNVRVFPKDMKEIGMREVDILYKISIDSLGKVTASNIEEYYSSSQGTGFQAGHLPDEIENIIDAMPLWKPAMINENPVEITFYLPICFKLNLNKIVMLPSKYKFKFHNRKQ